MSIKIKIYGDKIDLADELEEEFHQLAKDAVGEAADMLLADIHDRLDNRRGPAPAPEGEAPAMQTGELSRSFKRINPRIRGRVASSGIISRHPGANRLEFGATDSRGIRTLPHPYVRPALDAMEEPISRLLEEKLGGSPS